MFGKRWVQTLLEHLQQGLLDQPVDDTRHAELSDPAIRLGYLDPFDRQRLVGSPEQLRPDVWPLLTQVILGVIDGHPIHARTALIPSNAFPRCFEIFPAAHLLHQLFRRSRAFGCWVRRGRFGPWRTAGEGFALAAGSKATEQWVFCRFPFMSRQSYLPLPIVRAFSRRSRLGLSVAPPSGIGVPH